ncbi:MAG: sigma-70 family RNA polymerase sigma factor [Candidatus Marinimicrobia bacterium]|nr:sigma-70 family RNA polymerase sigma factor [Candidatus Neomarinimicrobiota bacterium]
MQQTETDLIKQAKSGDSKAMAGLVKRHSANIYNVGLRLMQNETEAEDVLQETFLTMVLKLDTFGGKSALSTWLYRIATNIALGKIREKQKRNADMELDKLDFEPLTGNQILSWPEEVEQMWKDQSIQSCMKAALEKLPESHRAVFVMRDLEGMSVKETATLLDLSESNVKVQLMRARLFLRDNLAKNLHCIEANA